MLQSHKGKLYCDTPRPCRTLRMPVDRADGGGVVGGSEARLADRRAYGDIRLRGPSKRDRKLGEPIRHLDDRRARPWGLQRVLGWRPGVQDIGAFLLLLRGFPARRYPGLHEPASREPRRPRCRRFAGGHAALCVGRGGKNIEGGACLQGSQGAANSGALLLYDTNNVQQGLVGAANAAGLNVKASNGTVFLNSKNGTASATAKFGANASSQNLVNLSPLPTTPPSGTGGLYVCVDNA